MEGRRIGRYVVGPEIAWGGMASVHLGRMIGPKGFGKTVALKRLRSQYTADPDFVKMFHDEARVTSALTHANIVMTLDVVEDDDDLFLVMEYVHGASLAQISRVAASTEPLPIPITAAIISGMLDGLFAAHEATDENGQHLNVIHRDVSPQNVLVTFEGVPKLADFGIAKAAGRAHSTADGSAKGKVSYMAPEQVLSEPVTALSDVYAAGVVLWECLTNQRLVDGRSTAECLRALIDLKVQPPSTLNPKIPADLDAVVMKALQRSPQKRFKNAREMAAALRKSVEVAHTNELADWIRIHCAGLKEQRDKGLTNLQRVLGSSGLTAVGIGGPDSSSAFLPAGKKEEQPPGSKDTPSGSASSTPLENTKKPALIFGTPRWLVLTVGVFLSLSLAGVLFAVMGMQRTPSTTTATTGTGVAAASSTGILLSASASAVAPSSSASAGPVEVAGPAIEIVEAPATTASATSKPARAPIAAGNPASIGGKKKCKIVTSTDSSGHTKFTEVCN